MEARSKMPDTRSQRKEIPFSGKFWTTEAAAIGTNFQTLKNMRYTDTHIKGVSGMTKINVTALGTFLKVRNAFHFSKSQPAESHVMVQAYNTGLTAAHILEHTAAIPATGAFSATVLLTCTSTSGFGLGRFCDAPDGQMIYADGVNTHIWGGSQTKCGAVIQTSVECTAATDQASSPKDVTEIANNTKTDSANVFTCGSTYKTFIIGSPRPAQGATFTFSTVNATANTLTVKESTATIWTTITATGITDGTASGGASFAVNGKISWPTTVSTTKLKYLEGYYQYWYEFTITDGSAVISHITLDLPFQALTDIWDGVYRDIFKFYKYTTSQADKTLNVFRDDYDPLYTSTFADISGLVYTSAGSFQYLELGFSEKQTGVYLGIPPGYENSTAATTIAVDYWNGAVYTTCGANSDGTSTGAVSAAKSGVISWNNTALESEQTKQYANAIPLYYYRLRWDKTLSSAVRINYVGGISASKTISHYKFPVFAQGRVLLCSDMSGEKNKAICSGKFMPQVYNGMDSVDLYFGDDKELTCGTELFSLFGASLYSLVLMFKDNETWVMAGQDISQWESNTFLLSSSIGCPAPLTLRTINLHAEPGAGVNRALAIWQGANGVYMSDGRAPIPIHGDIKEYFDPDDSRCILASKIGDSIGFIDPVRQEYHLLLASGSAATTLNTELVYDIARNKWFEIERSSDLQCGVTVHDTDGNGYAYGFLDTGYMERLEYGTTFDGTAITNTVQTGDIALGGLSIETRLSEVRLITVAKTSGDVTLTHYSDTSTTGTDHTMSEIRSGYRVAIPKFNDKLDADPFHSFRFVTTGSFEPLAMVATHHSTHADS